MNEEKLGYMERDLSATPPASILQVILEAVIQAKTDQDIGQGDWEILLDNRRKRRGKDTLKPIRRKKGRM